MFDEDVGDGEDGEDGDSEVFVGCQTLLNWR